MNYGISCAIVFLLLPAGIVHSETTKNSGLILKPVPDARIEVFKSERRLRLYSGTRLIRDFRIGLGGNPVGPKIREGDGATPEGEYRVCVKNPQSRFYLSVGISYPGPEDADRGVQAGLIGASEQRKIVAAAEKGSCPPWNTALGGEIFIHGNGSSSDWTLGCIALDDADMQEIYAAVEIGTVVVIHP